MLNNDSAVGGTLGLYGICLTSYNDSYSNLCDGMDQKFVVLLYFKQLLAFENSLMNRKYKIRVRFVYSIHCCFDTCYIYLFIIIINLKIEYINTMHTYFIHLLLIKY